MAIETGSSQRATRVVLADDHDVFRRGLSKLLRDEGIDVVGEVANGRRAVELVQQVKPDVVVLDLNMPVMSGIEATRELTESGSPTRMLALTVVADHAHVLEAVVAGASGYVLKDAPVSQIVDAIHAAARGDAVLSPRVAGALIAVLREERRVAAQALPEELTARELDVLGLLTEGMDNTAIAKGLGISQNTVKIHVSKILAKLNVDNRTRAAVRAVRDGLLRSG